ncbi:MAG: N-acetyl sugar amidotransferase [Labilithrix sp.]|nr:N-acetyl sugar amidotransferase [Labilithrix sp.]MCW5832798.1 N-acetyl sugar amidotransferase [Labilithrix sp.]
MQVCSSCVIDAAVPTTVFDADGRCSWCRFFDERARRSPVDPARRDAELARVLATIKEAGRGHRYDCVIGISGGVDSSYAALVAKRHGLRPLLVHVDNGWNTELAVGNIEAIVRGLELDLVTEVIDWEEFRGLQLSLLRAGVVDLELVSDHAIVAAMYHAARRHRVRFIVTGDNEATEATLPRGWNHRKTDLRNIRAINRAHERASMKTFPRLSTIGMLAHKHLLRIEYVGLLSYVEYVKERAIHELETELGWRRYGKKHFESVITRFYQGYILPTKFAIDKRKFHYSLLIHSGQMTRDEALADLATPPYEPRQQLEDKVYVCKKFGVSVEEFDRMMAEPPRSHSEYPTDEALLERLFRLNRGVRRVRRLIGR